MSCQRHSSKGDKRQQGQRKEEKKQSLTNHSTKKTHQRPIEKKHTIKVYRYYIHSFFLPTTLEQRKYNSLTEASLSYLTDFFFYAFLYSIYYIYHTSILKIISKTPWLKHIKNYFVSAGRILFCKLGHFLFCKCGAGGSQNFCILLKTSKNILYSGGTKGILYTNREQKCRKCRG